MKLYQCQKSFDVSVNGSIKNCKQGEYYSFEIVEGYIKNFIPSDANVEGLLFESTQSILENCNKLCKTKELLLG